MPKPRLCYYCRKTGHIAKFCPEQQRLTTRSGDVVNTTAGRICVRHMSDDWYNTKVKGDINMQTQQLDTKLRRHGIQEAMIREVLKEVAMEAFIRGYDHCCDRMVRKQQKSSK